MVWYGGGAASGPLCKAKPKPLVQKTRMQSSRNQILPFTNIYQNRVRLAVETNRTII